MGRNITGTNAVKSNISFNFVAIYITKAEPYYYNYFSRHTKGPAPDNYAFVGFFHTIRGKGHIKLINQEFYVKENDIIFICYTDLVSIASVDGEWEYYCLWFYLNNLLPPYNKVHHLKPLPHQRDTVLKMIDLLNANDYYYLCQANGLGQALLCELLSHLQKAQKTNAYQQQLRDIVFYINQHIEENISIKELAEKCHICEKHFRAVFTKEIGMPPKQYIIKAKLEKAAFFLANSPWSVTEISDTLSFLTPTYFVNSFKKFYKKTPLQYRKDYYENAKQQEKERTE